MHLHHTCGIVWICERDTASSADDERGGNKMLKLKVIEYPKNNNHYFDFVDEFSGKSWNGKTFQTLDEAVSYARENIVHKGESFDLISICKPEYTIEIR